MAEPGVQRGKQAGRVPFQTPRLAVGVFGD